MTKTKPVIALHFDLLQDVAVLRPLARMAARLDVELLFLVSSGFVKLDIDRKWRRQIDTLAGQSKATILAYEAVFDVYRALNGRRGLCIAGSESEVPAHARSHALFRALPPGILKVTLQHGFECVGFLHNERHSATAGRDVRFAADILVGWFAPHRLLDVSPAERPKLLVAGPPSLIGKSVTPVLKQPASPFLGLVCENTHSVRFASGAMKRDFLDDVAALAERSRMAGARVHLRPHPAGQFLKRTGYAPPPAMQVADKPLYKTDLTQYAYALSAPSTILFDCVMAGVPSAIWGADHVDTRNYAGLFAVRSAEEAWRFAAASMPARRAILERQQRFIDGLGLPPDVSRRYQELMGLAFS